MQELPAGAEPDPCGDDDGGDEDEIEGDHRAGFSRGLLLCGGHGWVSKLGWFWRLRWGKAGSGWRGRLGGADYADDGARIEGKGQWPGVNRRGRVEDLDEGLPLVGFIVPGQCGRCEDAFAEVLDDCFAR